MNLVNLERVVKGYGQRLLLNGVSAGVAAGERVGVVGRNGAGKSTLLALLAGTDTPDGGRVTRARDLRIAHLAQQDRLTGTVGDLVTRGRPEHVWAGDPRTRSAVAALLPGIDFSAQAERLSGGESRRVALAALLLGDHDLLLLDEPTNHLDVEAVNWLARFLAAAGTALVVVTHDRWFLDAVCERTWELSDGQLHAYEGGYAAYVLARSERARLADAAQRRRRNLLRKELAWLRRGPPARTSKPQFRIEAANALIADEPAPRNGVELARLATARLGKTVIDAEDLTVRAGERVLLDDVTWQLGPGDRVGLVGPNGSGKTTLLRVLAGEGLDREAGPGGVGHALRHFSSAAGSCGGRRCGWGIWRRMTRGWIFLCRRGKSLPRCAGMCWLTRGPDRLVRCWRCWGCGGMCSSRRRGSCRAGSGAGCRCCGCWWMSRMCCCWTSRPTILM